MSAGNVVKFPIGRIADRRFVTDDGSEIEALQRACDSALAASHAARRQYCTLMLRLWRARGIKPCKSVLKTISEGAAPEAPA